MGDIVATVASPGHDIGIVLTGELVPSNEEKRSQSFSNEIPKIYRKASQKTLTFGLLAIKKNL
jgi:hypothetical protein